MTILVTIYLFKGIGNNEKIGGDYDCRLDAMAAIKDHALNSGREQIYGLCVNGLMTHFVKSNGYHFDIWELPVNMQTRMSEIQTKDYGEHIIETIKTISEKNGEEGSFPQSPKISEEEAKKKISNKINDKLIDKIKEMCGIDIDNK